MKNGKRGISVEDIESAEDIGFEEVAVPEWGAGNVVYLYGLSGDVGIPLYESAQGKPKREMMYLALSATMSDGEGNRLFKSPEEARDILKHRNMIVLMRLFESASILLGWTSLATAKNASGEAVVAASPTDSPSSSAT